MRDESFIECERMAAFTPGLNEEASGSMDVARDAGDGDPDTVLERYHFANGTYLEMSGLLEDAIYEFRVAAGICPDNGFYRYTLGVALLRNGQYNDAYKELTEAVRLDPDNFEACCALADVHGEIGLGLELEGCLGAAADELREAIALDPEYPDYHAQLGRVLLGIAEGAAPAAGVKRGEAIFDAIGHLRSALLLDPDCTDARLHLGRALTMEGSGRAMDEGITMLSSVLLIDPFNDVASSCLDYARKIRGEAIDCY